MNMKLLAAAGCVVLGLAACGSDVPTADQVIPRRDGGVVVTPPDGGPPPDGGAPNSVTTFVNGLIGQTNDTAEPQNIDAIAGADPDTVPSFDALFP